MSRLWIPALVTAAILCAGCDLNPSGGNSQTLGLSIVGNWQPLEQRLLMMLDDDTLSDTLMITEDGVLEQDGVRVAMFMQFTGSMYKGYALEEGDTQYVILSTGYVKNGNQLTFQSEGLDFLVDSLAEMGYTTQLSYAAYAREDTLYYNSDIRMVGADGTAIRVRALEKCLRYDGDVPPASWPSKHVEMDMFDPQATELYKKRAGGRAVWGIGWVLR